VSKDSSAAVTKTAASYTAAQAEATESESDSDVEAQQPAAVGVGVQMTVDGLQASAASRQAQRARRRSTLQVSRVGLVSLAALKAAGAGSGNQTLLTPGQCKTSATPVTVVSSAEVKRERTLGELTLIKTKELSSVVTQGTLSESETKNDPPMDEHFVNSTTAATIRPPSGARPTTGIVRRYIIPRAAYNLVCDQDSEDLLEARKTNSLESYSPAAREAIAHYDAARRSAASSAGGVRQRSSLRFSTAVPV